MKADVLVIGAGMAGLTAATKLVEAGLTVCVAEKARGSGGRLSSKRLSHEGKDYSFDLGASHIEASTPEFRAALKQWAVEKSVVPYGETQDLFIGSPRNSSVTRNLANKVEAHFSTRITSLVKTENGWQAYAADDSSDVEGKSGTHLFCEAQWLILSAPSEQSFNLLPEHHPLRPALADLHIRPSWVMLAVIESDKPIKLGSFDESPIKSISVECRKRGAPEDQKTYCLQVQANESWSEDHINDGFENIAGNLTGALSSAIESPFTLKTHHVHRWLYANADGNNPPCESSYLIDEHLGVCGDYLGRSRSPYGVEAAFLSGSELAAEVIERATLSSQRVAETMI